MSYLTKQELVNKINTNFASAKPEKITATDLREVMLDCSDSLANTADTDSYSIVSKTGDSLIASLKEIWQSNAGTFHFATTSVASQTIQIKTTTGYARLIGSNGSLGSVVGSGNPSVLINVVFSEGNGIRAFGIMSTTSNGNVRNGDITYIYMYNKRIVSFDGTLLTGLTSLDLSRNQLVDFKYSSLNSLVSLNLYNNKLINFGSQLEYGDAGYFPYLTTLSLALNRIEFFSSSGLNALTTLDLQINKLSSFYGGNLNNLLDLNLSGNHLTQFDKTGLSGLVQLFLSSNNIKEFDGTSLTALQIFSITDCELTSISNLESYNLNDIGINDNLLTSQILDDLFNFISPNIYNNNGFIDCSNNTGQPTNASSDARDLMINGGWTIIT